MIATMLSCSPAPPIPTNKRLVRVDAAWSYPPPEVHAGRTAPATIVVFKSSGEYVEHHCWVIEQIDGSFTISGGDPHVVAVGTWQQQGDQIRAHREAIERTVRLIGGGDPLCQAPEPNFAVRVGRIFGSAGADRPGEYRAWKVESSDFEAYVKEARRGTKCPGA